MWVTPIKSFPHDRRGQMLAGRAYDLPEAEAARLLKLGLVRVASPDEYETKVVAQTPVAPTVPSQAAGEAQPSSASPAAQVSAQTIARPSEGGDTYPITLKIRENPITPEQVIETVRRMNGKKKRNRSGR